jgi:HlyD family secretion protein
MKRKTIYYLVAAVVVLVIVLLVMKSKGMIGQQEGIQVAVDPVTYKTVTETVSASGKVYPEIEVKVSPDVSGEITDLPIEEGDSVTKGQEVAKIYADVYNSIKQQSLANVSQMQAQLANATASLSGFKAKLDQAKATFGRDQELVAQKVISRVEYEQAQSDYQSALSNYNAAQEQIHSGQYAVASAQANLSQAEDNLHRTTIIAPMSGYVSSLLVKKGERVVGTAQMAGTEMMSIANMDTMEIQVDVGENDIPKVNYGDTANIQVDAYNDRVFKGIVTKIATSSGASAQAAATTSASADQVTDYTVHIRILRTSYADLVNPKNPRHFPFRPGMSASVDIQTETHRNVVAVPINSVTTRENSEIVKSTLAKNNTKAPAATSVKADTSQASSNEQEVVFVLQKDNTVKIVPVKTDIQDDNFIQVISGLDTGTRVVTSPYTAVSKVLQNGSKVKVVPQSQLFMVAK